jgi:hypothetical protein
MPITKTAPSLADDALDSADHDALLVSLEQGRADIAAGRFDVLTPGTLRREFEAILADDPTDDELDAMLGIAPRSSG